MYHRKNLLRFHNGTLIVVIGVILHFVMHNPRLVKENCLNSLIPLPLIIAQEFP